MADLMKKITWLSGVLTACFLGLFLWLGGQPWLTLAITSATMFYHFAMRLAVGYAYQRRFQNHMDWKHPWFRVSARETKLYGRLRVGRWKRHLPTYDQPAFDLGRQGPHQVAMAMCQAELVHETIVFLSFLPLSIVPWVGSFWVVFLTSICAAVLDLLFVIVQRYNRPRILRLADSPPGSHRFHD